MGDTDTQPQFRAEPNQKSFDATHITDHVLEVVDVYFAEKKIKYKWAPKTETYKVKSGGKVSDVLKSYQDKFAAAKTIYQNLTATPNHNNPLAKGDQIVLNWEEGTEDGFEYPKINKIVIGKKLFLVAICNSNNGTLNLELFENQQTFPSKIFPAAVPFLDAGAEVKKITFTIEAAKREYVKEITLRPKAEKDYKDLLQKFVPRAKKNAFLYIKATAQIPTGTVTYNTATNTNEYRNTDGDRLEVIGTPCYCNRDITEDEMLEIVYMLRDKQSYVSLRERFFDSGGSVQFISSIRHDGSTALSAAKSKVGIFVTEMNAMFTKFGVNTCKRKIHFIAQMYLETASFRATYENRPTVPSNYRGGVDFQGRGMKQITHNYNYLAYYDYVNSTTHYASFEAVRNAANSREQDVEVVIAMGAAQKNPIVGFDAALYTTLKTFATQLASDLFHSFNSAGWFATVYRSDTLAAMDKGLADADVKAVTLAINGGDNNLAERQNYTKWIKAHFKFDTECINK